MKKTFVISLGIAAMTLAAGSAFAATTPMYFLNHEDLPSSGVINTWDGATKIGSPEVETNNVGFGAEKWVKLDRLGERGFLVASPKTPIAVSGASFVVAARRGAVADGNPWTSIIDVMYDKLTLGINNTSGEICVRRNGSLDYSGSLKAIAVGQSTILSMVCQSNGAYEVWADGVSMLSRGAQGTMTEWDNARLEFKDQPDWAATQAASGMTVNVGNWDQWHAAMISLIPALGPTWINNQKWDALPSDTKNVYWGYTGKVDDFKGYITVGRNKPDGWTSFNGSIGDVKIFGTALGGVERSLLENQMAIDMGLKAAPPAVPEPSSVLAALSILGPAGMMFRRRRK